MLRFTIPPKAKKPGKRAGPSKYVEHSVAVTGSRTDRGLPDEIVYGEASSEDEDGGEFHDEAAHEQLILAKSHAARQGEEEDEQWAQHEGLTGAERRRVVAEALDEAAQRAERTGRKKRKQALRVLEHPRVRQKLAEYEAADERRARNAFPPHMMHDDDPVPPSWSVADAEYMKTLANQPYDVLESLPAGTPLNPMTDYYAGTSRRYSGLDLRRKYKEDRNPALFYRKLKRLANELATTRAHAEGTTANHPIRRGADGQLLFNDPLDPYDTRYRKEVKRIMGYGRRK